MPFVAIRRGNSRRQQRPDLYTFSGFDPLTVQKLNSLVAYQKAQGRSMTSSKLIRELIAQAYSETAPLVCQHCGQAMFLVGSKFVCQTCEREGNESCATS